jgi:Fe-Mn family superoxide dismutase
MLNRRELIVSGIGALAAGVFGGEIPRPRGVPLELEPLGFDYNALEPFLDAESLRYHHDVYHAECLRNLQKELNRVNFAVGNVAGIMPSMHRLRQPADDRHSVLTLGHTPGAIAEPLVQSIRKYGGAHVNHTSFWRSLAPAERSASGPKGRSARAIHEQFGGFDDFKRAFSAAALNHFGSGWAWLSHRYDGRLIITTTANEDNPLMDECIAWQDQGKPILCLDLWEHAYAGKYNHDRRKYVAAWWKCVNWDSVERSYGVATSRT